MSKVLDIDANKLNYVNKLENFITCLAALASVFAYMQFLLFIVYGGRLVMCIILLTCVSILSLVSLVDTWLDTSKGTLCLQGDTILFITGSSTLSSSIKFVFKRQDVTIKRCSFHRLKVYGDVLVQHPYKEVKVYDYMKRPLVLFDVFKDSQTLFGGD